jgi:bifunctional UDP-N-acetylglucosamine pyrophosphorylase/glucosamine-1-phosphate N-acetyltransferase
MKNLDKTRIIILAAGKSTRMKSDIPKALMPLMDKPFIQHILDTIKTLDPNIKPIIVVGHKKEMVQKALGENYIYAEQREQLGTGHAVMSAQNSMDSLHETVLVLATDQPMVSRETLESIIEKHQEKNPSITMGIVTVPDFKDWRTGLNHFGRIIRGSDGLVKKIVEFKDANNEEKEIRELNPALYAFNAKWLWENIDKLRNENVQGEYYLTDLVKLAFEQNKKIETVQIKNIIEALQPNSKEELESLEKIAS